MPNKKQSRDLENEPDFEDLFLEALIDIAIMNLSNESRMPIEQAYMPISLMKQLNGSFLRPRRSVFHYQERRIIIRPPQTIFE